MIQSKLVTELCSFIKILDNYKINYCLIGGLAVVVRAYERTTKDIDFMILVSKEKEVEDVIRKIRNDGYEIFSLLENHKKKIVSTVRLLSPNKKMVVDLLFNSCGIESEIINLATKVEIFDSVICNVASLSSLIAMKMLSSNNPKRLQDIIDLQNLIPEATQAELDQAHELINLIQERNFNRGEDLTSRYLNYIKEFKE